MATERTSRSTAFDNSSRFWFRFVHPFQDRLDLGWQDAVMDQEIAPYIDAFVADAFEDAALAYVAAAGRGGELPFTLSRIGRWWSPDAEIDLVGISDRTQELLIGECKWTKRPVGTNVLDTLRTKSVRLPGGPWSRETAILFSKAGFTPALKSRAANEDVLLVSPAEMVGQTTGVG